MRLIKITALSILIPLSFSVAGERTTIDFTLAKNSPITVNQKFSDYKEERNNEPLKLLFPGGRNLSDLNDPRGDQQKHKGFYTIDDFSNRNPHLEGNIFNPETWKEVENGVIDVTHIEIPGSLFLYGDEHEQGRVEKDNWILKQTNEKSKIGGKLFVDLRYNRFRSYPNFDTSLNYKETKEKIESFFKEDPDSFADFSYTFNENELASFWHNLIGAPQDKILDSIRIHNEFCGHNIKDYTNFEKEVNEKLESMSDEEIYTFQSPYVILFDQKTRDGIFKKYDSLFRQYGFIRINSIIEIYGKINNKILLPEHCTEIEGRVLFQGMCFMDTIAEYEKVENLSII